MQFFFRLWEYVLGDGIFSHPHVKIPFNTEALQKPNPLFCTEEEFLEQQKLRAEKKRRTKLIGRSRCVVENVITRIKKTFRILYKKWKYKDANYKRLYNLCCALYNFLCMEGFHQWPRDRQWFESNARYDWEVDIARANGLNIWEDGVAYVDEGRYEGDIPGGPGDDDWET